MQISRAIIAQEVLLRPDCVSCGVLGSGLGVTNLPSTLQTTSLIFPPLNTPLPKPAPRTRHNVPQRRCAINMRLDLRRNLRAIPSHAARWCGCESRIHVLHLMRRRSRTRDLDALRQAGQRWKLPDGAAPLVAPGQRRGRCVSLLHHWSERVRGARGAEVSWAAMLGRREGLGSWGYGRWAFGGERSWWRQRAERKLIVRWSRGEQAGGGSMGAYGGVERERAR